MIEKMINELGRYQDFSIDGNVEKFECKLSDLLSTGESEIISKLLLFFSDECDFPEIMYNIIHTIETFDDEIYINQLFKTITKLWEKSPYWTSVLHYRILNSETTIKQYEGQLFMLDASQKKAIREILIKIESESKEFSGR